MSDEPKPPPAEGEKPKMFVLELVDWMTSLGEPYTFEETNAIRVEVEAGRLELTEREKRILSIAGLIIGNAAHEHAGRMFTRAVGTIIMRGTPDMARMLGLIGGDDDDDEPGGGRKPS